MDIRALPLRLLAATFIAAEKRTETEAFHEAYGIDTWDRYVQALTILQGKEIHDLDISLIVAINSTLVGFESHLRTGPCHGGSGLVTAEQIAAAAEARVVFVPSSPVHGVFEYPAPEIITPRLQELIDVLKKNVSSDGAADFERGVAALHPFKDGNGRTARALMNWVLLKSGSPPAVLENQDNDFCSTKESWRKQVAEGILEAERYSPH